MLAEAAQQYGIRLEKKFVEVPIRPLARTENEIALEL
jgi:hypothetical protein